MVKKHYIIVDKVEVVVKASSRMPSACSFLIFSYGPYCVKHRSNLKHLIPGTICVLKLDQVHKHVLDFISFLFNSPVSPLCWHGCCPPLHQFYPPQEKEISEICFNLQFLTSKHTRPQPCTWVTFIELLCIYKVCFFLFWLLTCPGNLLYILIFEKKVWSQWYILLKQYRVIRE